METIISVNNISKSYRLYNTPSEKLRELLHPFGKKYHKEFWALRDVSFEIKKGESVGIIGRNGSGKSTLLKILCGVLQPNAGTASVSGRVSALLELGAGFNPEYTGRQNVYMNGALRGFSKKEMDERFDSIAGFADVGDFLDQPVKVYSSGMFVRLAFSCAVNVDPDVLIVDEALAVGDDVFKRRCYRRMEGFQKDGKSIIFVSHGLGLIVSMFRKAILLDKGALVTIGSSRDVANVYSKLAAEDEEAYARKRGDMPASSQERDEEAAQAAVPPSGGPDAPERKPASGPGREEDGFVEEFRFGSGGAEIIGIRIEDMDGQAAAVLISGETYLIKSKVCFRREIKEPFVGFAIKTLQGQVLLGTNTLLAGHPIGRVKPGVVAEVEFELKMVLRPGSYTLSSSVVEVAGENQVVRDRRRDAIVFKVVGKDNYHGLFACDMPVRVKFSQF
ncbi:MAG: ABC transporter ATP-binding protein [Deltaproteobacteria bacterium]|nr:ABC transporter ATP-binding protein [Deltaproteobacteria bacterium]